MESVKERRLRDSCMYACVGVCGCVFVSFVNRANRMPSDRVIERLNEHRPLFRPARKPKLGHYQSCLTGGVESRLQESAGMTVACLKIMSHSNARGVKLRNADSTAPILWV